MALPTKETLQNAERVIPDATKRTLVEYPSNIPKFQMNLETATGGGNQQSDAYSRALLLASPTKPSNLTSSSTFSYNPLQIDTSGRYDRFILGQDNEDIQGKLQSGWDQAANGLVKGLGIAGTTFLDGTVGLIAGLTSSIANGSLNKFYNNDFTNYMDSLNKSMENKLPNYYTASERDAKWYEAENLFTANFFWDKIIKNLGFSAGAIGAGAVTAGLLSKVPALFGISKAGKLAQVADALEVGLKGVPEIERAAKAADIIAQTSKTINTLNKLSSVDRAVVAGLSAATEGGIEALQGLNSYRDKLIAQYQDTYGEYPPEDVLNKINNRAEDLGNARFGLNVLLLSATNYIQLPRILGSSYRSGKNTLINSAKTNLETGLLESSLPTKGIGKALYKARNVASLFFSPTEGFEEGAQYAIERGTQSYYNKKNYSKDESLGSFINSFSEAAGEGIKAVGDKEGMESILIGALSGGIQQAGFVGMYKNEQGNNRVGIGKGGAIGERGFTGYGGEMAKNTEDLIKQSKRFSLKGDEWLKDTKAGVKRGVVLQEEFDQHVRIGDVLEAKDTEFDYQHNYLLPRIKYGRYDLVKDDIDYYKGLASTQEGFDELKKKGIASELDTQQSFIDRIDNFAEHAKVVNSLNESLNLRYAGVVYKDTNKRAYSDDAIEQMIYAAAKISDYDKRVPQLTDKLVAAGIVVSNVLDDIISEGLPKEEVVKQAINDIDKLNVIEDVKVELKENLRDAVELSIRRKDFIDEYSNIKKNPAKYTEDKGDKPLNTNVQTVKIVTKTGEKDIVVGEELFLGNTVKYTSKGEEVRGFPRLTILGENEDGSIKIKDSNGDIRDISKSELADYKLSKVSDTLTNKTAAYYLAHVNDIFQYNFGQASEDKKRPGRLEYEDGKLFFVYKNYKGEIKRKQIDNSHFVAQEGFRDARIKTVGTLTAESAEKKAAREAFTSAEELKKQQQTLAQNRDNRLEIITELSNEHIAKLEAIEKKLEAKKEQLQKVTEDLEELKTLEKRDLSGNIIVRPFNTVLSKAMRGISTLNNTKDALEKEIAELTADKDELEFNIAYFEDFKQNLDELPENSGQFLEELKFQILIAEELRDKTQDNIKSLGGIIQKIDSAIKDFTQLLKDAFAKFDQDYPSYIKDEFERIIDEGSTLSDLPSLKQFIADYVLLNDTKKEISLNKEKVSKLSDEINDLFKDFIEVQKDYDAKKLILDKFQEVADKYRQMKAEEDTLKKDKALQNVIDQSADKGIQTVEHNKPFEAMPKKSNEKIPNSTVAPVQGLSQESELAEHHVRANKFGVNFYDLPGHENFRGVIVTSENEAQIGLPGLTQHLKDAGINPEDVTPTRTIALVMVSVDPNNGEKHLIGVDGQRLESPTVDNAIYQVFPENIDRMFRDDVDDDTKKQIIDDYRKWRNETIANPINDAHEIEASFGVPDYLQRVLENGDSERDYEADGVPVSDSALLTEEDIRTKRVVGIPTTDGAQTRGSVTFNNVKGLPLLFTSNGMVRLRNRQINNEEATLIHKVLVELSDILYKDKNWQSPKAQALLNWLKSVSYWGTPKDAEGNRKPAGYNSMFVENMELIMSEDETIRFAFTPSNIRDNKDAIIAEIEKLYGNVNSTMVTGGKSGEWNKSYVQITNIAEDGSIETKTWKNYQSFLLSKVDPDGKTRNAKEIPLTTQIRPVKDANDVNRKGVYFTVTDRNNADTEAVEVSPTAATVTQTTPYGTEAGPTLTTSTESQDIKAKKANIMSDWGYEVSNEEMRWSEMALAAAEDGNDINTPESEEEAEDWKKNGTPQQQSINKINAKYEKLLADLEASKTAAPVATQTTPTTSYVFDNKTQNVVTFPNIGPVSFILDLNKYNNSERKEGIAMAVPDTTLENMVVKLVNNSAQSGITQDSPEEEQNALAENVLRALVKKEIDKQLNAQVVAPTVVLPVVEEERKAAEITVISPSLQQKIDQVTAQGDTAMSSQYRIKLVETFKKFQKEDWSKVEAWLKANFPNIPVYRVKNMIQATNGRQAWGMLHDGAIYLSADNEIGTVYHEVFEAVWKMFTTPQERAKVAKEFRARKGSFIERETADEVKFADATDAQMKEQLAEEFRNMSLTGKNVGVATEGMSTTRRILNEIWEAIKAFFTGDKAQTNTANLFDRIGNGFYKEYIPEEAGLSFANKGFIDIEDAVGNDDSEFSLAVFSGEQIHDIIQHMTYTLVKDLFSTNQGLFEMRDEKKKDVYARLKQEMELLMAQNIVSINKSKNEQLSKEDKADKIKNFVQLSDLINLNWDLLQEKHEEYIKSYSIQFDENDGSIRTDEDNDGKGTMYGDANKIDVFKKANSAIKILLASLPVVDVNGDPLPSSIGGFSLIPMSEVFISVMNNTHTAKNIDEMVADIQDMAKNDIRYQKLFNRITKGKNIEDFDNEEDIKLLTALWATFKKQSPDVKNVYILENGDIQVGDSNFSTAARQVKQEFVNDIKKSISNGSKYFRYSEKAGAFVGEIDSINDVKLNSLQAQVNFMKDLGIDFDYKKLVKMPEKGMFSIAVNGIRESISKANKIISFNGQALSIDGRLRQLSEIKAKMDNPEFSSTYYNVKGELTQTFIGTNAASDLYNTLSQISNISELQGTQYEYLLTDTFAKNSTLLGLMFDLVTGKRIEGSNNYMKTGYADGVVDQETGKQKQSSKLNSRERMMQEINLNLSGYYLNLVPGDSSIEWMMYMGNKIKPDDLLLNRQAIFDVFKGYFIDELNLSRENRKVVEGRNSKDLRFFKNILGEKIHNDIITEKGTAEEIYGEYEKKINTALNKFFDTQREVLKNTLSDFKLIEQYENTWISESLNFDKKEFTNETLDIQLDALNASFAINNIELHKLLYSDPYQYADELKRIKSFSSPRQAIINGSIALNKAFQKVWNKAFKPGEIGYTNFERDFFRSTTLTEIMGIDDAGMYDAYKEGDGGGMISLNALRNFKIRASKWDSGQERQYKYDVAWEKQYKFYKKIKGVSLNAQDKKILAKGNPNIKRTYTPIKPIVAGAKLSNNTWNDIILDKFSLYPLSFRVLHEINTNTNKPTSNALKMYEKMQAEDIDYVVFESARKVGAEETHDVYNEEDGSFNDSPFQGVIQVPFAIISIQSEVPSHEDGLVTRGSQMTKLATLDFMEAGIPVDFVHNDSVEFTTKRYEAWYNLSEVDREAASPLYKEIKNNQNLLEELMEIGIESLANKFDIKIIKNLDKDGKVIRSFELGDIKKVATTLQKELTKREINVNISEALKDYKSGSVVIEATPAYRQIRNILYSIADREVISPSMPGGMLVQITSSLLESVKAKKVTINGKTGYTSDTLSFYKKDGKQVCGIMVARWFDSKKTDKELLDEWYDTDKDGNKTLTEEGRKILSGVAFRTPTQKQNSMESFVIEGLLPREFGDSVVVPSELVAKVGSDFDIDKLSIYLKNVLVNKETGEVKLMPYKGIGKAARDTFNNVDDYKKSLENAYIESLQNLISNPLNYDKLVTANSAKPLEDLAKEITKKVTGIEFDYKSVDNMLSRTYMSELRHAFVNGKQAIGVAAVNNTNHSLNQRSTIYIDLNKLVNMSKQDQYWLGDGKLKFKKYNTINLKGSSVATLSMIKNKAGELISDTLGMFIDGYVDVTKNGPWIMQLGATPSVASTWMFLTKIGVPIRTTAYFMNQPIVRDYLKQLENQGTSWLFNNSVMSDMYIKYETNSKLQIEELPSEKELGEMVGKTGLTADEKKQQQFILGEFLKYAKMAEHMFLMIQGTNFDTASFNDPYLITKKLVQLEKARNTLFSSADDLLNSSFIGKLSRIIIELREALSKILKSDEGKIREVVEDVLSNYTDMNDRDFTRTAQRVVSTLFDWAVQTDKGLNAQITEALLSKDNTAKKITDFIEPIIAPGSTHPLANNHVIKILKPEFADKIKGKQANNLSLVNKGNKVYDQNQIIYSFKELKNYLNSVNNLELYDKLVTLAVLQSGLSENKFSFTSLLPYEDTKAIYNNVLADLQEMPTLRNFADLNVFERNYWNYDDIVKNRRARVSFNWETNSYEYNKNMEFSGFDYVSPITVAIKEKAIPQLIKLSTLAREASSDVFVYTWKEIPKGRTEAQMKKEGDFSYIKKGLFKKVYKDGVALEVKGGGKAVNYIYKMINAWGEGIKANEFYTTGQKSVIDNGFEKTNEMEDKVITPYFDQSVVKKVVPSQPMKAVSGVIDFQEEPTSGYRNRTIKNASADATIAIAYDFNSAGEKLTKSSVLNQNKKYLPVSTDVFSSKNDVASTAGKIAQELNKLPNNEITLNIAGNGIYTLKGTMSQSAADNFTLELLEEVQKRLNPEKKIVSLRTGGQTGFDEAGAKAGIKLGIPTTILAPKGWTFRNIAGQDISNEQQFKARFGKSEEDPFPC
jgi:hypothetical protein